jgi:2-polyprenyl-6-methoxyphenol hydroxylase-like FAD-dependent oxidoreductase
VKAIVIGGGVAGPVAALALRRIGWDVTIYEAYADPAGDVGSYVSLGANGLRALDAIGARAAVAARGTEIPLLRLWSGRGKLLGEASRGRLTLMRGHLVEAVRELAIDVGADMVTGCRLQTAGAAAKPASVLQPTHQAGAVAKAVSSGALGASHESGADLIVGADGVHSTLRTVIDPDAPKPDYAGLWTVGGRSAHPVEPGAFNLTFGARATFVHASTAHGTLWTAQVPARLQPEAPLDREALLALYAADRGPAAELIQHTDEWHPFTIMRQLPSVPRTSRENMILIGDAAHPIGAGQGASLAIEDAVLLAKCMRDRTGVPDALQAFEVLRRPRTDKMRKLAGASLDSKVTGPLTARVRDLMMPYFFRRFAEKGSAWMYDYDVDWRTPVATR